MEIGVEHNDFTGWEVLPSARLLWTPTSRQRVWAAVSRAVRTPSRVDHDIDQTLIGLPPNPLIPAGFPNPPGVIFFQGDRDFASEKLTAYELGYRVWPTEVLSLDLALFYNDYKDLRAAERRNNGIFFDGSLLRIPLTIANATEGNTYGAELAADWRAKAWVRLQLPYSYLQADLKTEAKLGNVFPQATSSSFPRHQVSLRSSFDIRRDLELDLWLRYVDEIPELRLSTLAGSARIDSYFTLDMRLGWRPYQDLELSLVGANLLDNKRLEYLQEVYPFPTQVERSVYGQVKWSF